jgi:uncharacterized membrane protein
LLNVFELISLTLSALVMGVFWGPWVGLTRSVTTFGPDVFLAVGYRLNVNLEPLMTVLMPVALLSAVPVLVLAYPDRPVTFALQLAGLVLFVLALVVTVIVEVPIAKRIRSWTLDTMPADWRAQRDRWSSFHLVRVATAIAGLMLMIAGALYR